MSETIEAAINSVLYVLNGLGGSGDFHKIFKILYFADRKHLVKYGSPILEDRYIRMDRGPVPSTTYDVLKALRNEGPLATYKKDFEKYFCLLDDRTIKILGEADIDYFSKSDLQCIDESLKENKNKPFKTLTIESHDYAWNNTAKDREIKIIDIAKAGGASKHMINYIKDHIENKTATFK